MVRRPRPPEVVAGDGRPPLAVSRLDELGARLPDPPPDRRRRGVDERLGLVEVAFGVEPLEVFGDVVGDPRVAGFALAAGGVLSAELQEPTIAGGGGFDRGGWGSTGLYSRLYAQGGDSGAGVAIDQPATASTLCA